jgi:hypothetical protein
MISLAIQSRLLFRLALPGRGLLRYFLCFASIAQSRASLMQPLGIGAERVDFGEGEIPVATLSRIAERCKLSKLHELENVLPIFKSENSCRFFRIELPRKPAGHQNLPARGKRDSWRFRSRLRLVVRRTIGRMRWLRSGGLGLSSGSIGVGHPSARPTLVLFRFSNTSLYSLVTYDASGRLRSHHAQSIFLERSTSLQLA